MKPNLCDIFYGVSLISLASTELSPSHRERVTMNRRGDIPKLSVIIPLYNEKSTITEILNRVLEVPVDKEIIIVDDGSTDGTAEILKAISEESIRVIFHERNLGKGCAIRTALQHARGTLIIIQDGDLEYDPMDYLDLIDAMNEDVGAVYGARNLSDNNTCHLGFRLGVALLSRLSNFLYGLNITDEATCYKLFRSEILKSVNLNCVGFEFCPEITAKLAKKGIKIKEIPISYYPRSFREGKKIRWIDGLTAAWILLRYRLVD